MEFNDVGSYCEVKECGQQDFLPFTCEFCKKKFCRNHKNYASHECGGRESKDMTSIDCPTCGTSVKFPQSESPDLIWTQHYSADCKRVLQEKEKKRNKCPVPMCPTILGISNIYQCTKCDLKICLSHRMPEDHFCSSLNKKQSQSMKSASFGRRSTKQTKQIDLVRETADRRKAAAHANWICSICTVINTPSSSICSTCLTSRLQKHLEAQNTNADTCSPVCPFCAIQFSNSHELITHINSTHPENNETLPSSNRNVRQQSTTRRTSITDSKMKCICS